MRVLVACEESQTVCKAFRNRGHEAYSCDVQDQSGGHPEWHIKDDVLKHLKGWDLIIAHPPCTDLACSGARHFERKKKDGSQQRSIDFFMALVNAPCEKIAVENPVCIMSSIYRKPDQIIQPYYFGDRAKKTTCLWLKGLPKLIPTNIVDEGEFYISPSGKKMAKWSHDPIDENGKKIPYNSKEIKKIRSKTFQGIADAMAGQWGKQIESLVLKWI